MRTALSALVVCALLAVSGAAAAAARGAVSPAWNVSEQYAMYTSASIARATPTTAGAGLQFSAGTWVAPPYECATYRADGSLAWAYAWPDASDEVELKSYSLQATSGSAAPVSVVCVANVAKYHGAGDKSVVVLAFAPDSTGAPLWTYDFEHNCQTDAADPVNDAALAADGATLAVVATCRNATDPFVAQTHVLATATGAPVCVYSTPSLASQASPVSASLSADGRYAAWNNYESAYVLDVAACRLRCPATPMGFQGEVAMTADAQYLLWAYETATISAWDDAQAKYVVAATIPGAKNGTQWYAEAIAVGLMNPPNAPPGLVLPAAATGGGGGGVKPDAALFAVGWTNGNADSVAVDLWSATGPVWSWRGPTSHDDQLIPSDVAISGTGGGYVAVATWGDYGESSDPCPQVYLFTPHSPQPVLSYITPGSMFAVDVVALPPAAADAADATGAAAATNEVWVVASGKHVHANVMGNGGDMYAFKVQA